jgi:hypothetical protein
LTGYPQPREMVRLEAGIRTRMRFKTWPVAAVGLAALLVLAVLSVNTASHRAQEIFTQLDQLNTHHRVVETKLRALRDDVQVSGIFVRDYLLDTSRERAPEYRSRLAQFRERSRATIRELLDIARTRGSSIGRLSRRSTTARASFAASFCRGARRS